VKQRMRGFGSCYQRSGGIWWCQYYVRGRRVRESSHSARLADAEKLLKLRHAEAASGKPVGSQTERTALRDLIEMLLNDYRANGRRSADRAEQACAHLRRFFGEDAKARDITADRITTYQANRLEAGAAVSTVNYECACLRRSFRLAVRAGKVAIRPEFDMLHVDNARQGFFEPEQYRAVLGFLPDYLKPVAIAAYITGWRTRSELLTREWRHVDLAAGWLRLEPGQGKTGQGRMFPLTPDLRAMLEAQRERVHAIERVTGQIVSWVFVHPDGTRIKDFRYSWAKACRQAGVPDRLVHDFRRTAVRNLERAGVPRSASMAMTGHKTATVFQRYAIIDSAMLEEAARKLAALHTTEEKQTSAKVIPLSGAR
jgi:integrase